MERLMNDNLEEQDWSWILADGEDIYDALAAYLSIEPGATAL